MFRRRSGLSALFVAGDGDIHMEMERGSNGQVEFETGVPDFLLTLSAHFFGLFRNLVRWRVLFWAGFRKIPRFGASDPEI